MLNEIREKHTKQVLWAITVIIVVTFGLGGAVSYIKGRQNPAIGKIGGKKIYASEADYYDKMTQAAKLIYMLNTKIPAIKSLETPREAGEYLLLVWKANKEKIKVTDAEIAKVIRAWFSVGGRFNKEAYMRFLNYGIHMQPSRFEEYIANFIKIDKLNEKAAKVSVNDAEVKELFIRDTQRAKLAYILIPYDKYLSSAKPDDAAIAKFYEENKLSFKKEPKAKFAYVAADLAAQDTLDNALAHVKSLKELSAKINLPVKETDFIANADSIGDFGWQPVLNQTAFSLKKGELSPVLQISGKTVVVQKIDETLSTVPKLEEIKDEVVEALKQRTSHDDCQAAAAKIIDQVKQAKISALKDVKVESGWQFAETKEFRANDYIEGIGLDLHLAGIAFSLKPGQIYPEVINLPKGAYIIQLVSKTEFDEEKYKNTKTDYEKYLRQQKIAEAQENMIEMIKESSKFEVYDLSAKAKK